MQLSLISQRLTQFALLLSHRTTKLSLSFRASSFGYKLIRSGGKGLYTSKIIVALFGLLFAKKAEIEKSPRRVTITNWIMRYLFRRDGFLGNPLMKFYEDLSAR
jgi:hypothetical protein